MFREFIAKLLGIDTYINRAYELIQENNMLRSEIFRAYEEGKQFVYNELAEKELKNICTGEEINIDDLIDITGEANEAN